MIADTQSLLDEILVDPDPVRRNRLITKCYADISAALADVVGRRDLNWFTFGAWASGTAGAKIRGEGVPIDLGTTRNMAAGNLAIITNIAPPAIAWLREVEGSGPTRPALQRALADPSFDGAPRLAEAITRFHEAAMLNELANTDPGADKAVAELVLLGNVRVGEHEQELVDRFVDAAMPMGCLFGLITTRFVAIETPDGHLDVCEDIVAPSYLAPELFPAPLLELTHPELVAACAALGQATGTNASQSHVLKWGDYDDRMGYILTFFRAYQRDTRMFDVPARYLPL